MTDEKSSKIITDSITLKNKNESSLLTKLEGKSDKMTTSFIKTTTFFLTCESSPDP